MLPNKSRSSKFLAATLVALLALQLVPTPASAQLGTADLVVESIDVGRVRVALLEAPINITVRNLGGDFGGAPGWEIFVSIGGTSNLDCIERGDNPVNPTPSAGTSPCYKVITTGNQNGDAVSIPKGESRTYTILWNAEREQANTAATIHAEILGLGGTPGANSDTCPEGSGEVCDNNLYTRSGVFIGEPGVRAVPQRQPSPSAIGGNKNSAWKSDEIDAACPASPGVLDVGCKARPGRSITASYLLTNVGTVDDSYAPVIVNGTVENQISGLLSRGYTFSFAPSTFSLGAGQSREVQLTMFIPENATALDTFNVDGITYTARWRSSLAPTGTFDDQNPGCEGEVRNYCVDASLPSYVVDYRRAFNVTANYTFDDMGLGETSTFFLNITNEGNADDAFNVSMLRGSRSINDSWSPTIVGGQSISSCPECKIFAVEKGKRVNVTIQLTPPLNATNSTFWFDTLVKSLGDTDGTAPCKRFDMTVLLTRAGECGMRFHAHVRQDWSITGFGDVAERLVPGETATYELGIRNRGNGYDNLSLELQTTVFGWDVRLSNSTIALTPFNTTTFSLRVTSPPNTPENTIGAFYVNATSSGPIETPVDSRSKSSIESLLTVVRGSNIRLDAAVNNTFVDAGAAATYSILVTNIGNIADNFTVATPERPADWGVTMTPDPTFLELQPNQQGSFTVELRAPSAALVGEKATAIVKVRSTVDPSRDKSVNLEARISGPDLFVDNVLINASNPYSGDPLDVSVVLGNSGNKAHERNMTLRVYFVQGGVERVIGERSYPALFIGGQRRLTETFPWDTSGIEGAGVILARVDVGDNVREIDDSAASNERTRAITLRTFDIKLTPAAGLSGRPGEQVSYGETPNVFVLRYDGNQPSEPVTVRFTSDHGWISSQEELTVELTRGTPTPVAVTLNVPSLPGVGKDTLTITVVPALRPEEVLRASAITTVIDEEKPIVKAIVATPATATLGETVTIEVVIEDATGASAATAYVTFPTNETSAVALTKVAPDRFRGERVFTVAGRYRVAAEVFDAAEPPNANTTRLSMGSFVMSPGSAPTIALASGQATTIRTGSPIKLDIRDPLGIGEASYNIKGVSYDLQGPAFQIDTSTFQAGNVEINVTAENIYGVATSKTFRFVVDNAAPSISRVAISPERPRANEDVTITIQTEAKVEAVDVLVKRDGQVVQTLNATKRGVGSFTATFNPGEGDYTLDVTARDAAGNTKLQDRAVEFSARAGSPFTPGPPVALILVALVALALVLRRRR